MKLWPALLVFLAGCSGCASVPSHDVLRDLALSLRFTDGVCSGTKVGPNVLETALHCVTGGPLVLVNGAPVQVVGINRIGYDRVEVAISGVLWKRWARRGPALKQGDRIRWWGNPLGEADMYREGYVSKVRPDLILIDAPICPGDSGSGLFNDRGELAGMVTSVSDEHGCTFTMERRG